MIPSLLPCPLKIRSRAFLPGLVLVLMLLAYPFQEGWCRGEDTAADLKATVTSQEDWFITRADSSSFALVLGGGGVRGFAHIGVLKVLEEEGLHPGLIVGTSMGAVIGALYSCGISAGQLEEMALRQDWLELFSYRRPPPLELQGGWHGLPSAQIALLTRGFPPMPPPSLARGQGVESLLGSLTAGALFAAGNDFDRLPIPFRGVATDLNTGDMVVLSRGSLATAVRASGTVPLLLPPVEWEGRELVDGGFRANNPLVVARAMGFSRALVVDVSNVFVPGKKTPQNLMEMWVRAMELQQYEGNRLDPHQGEEPREEALDEPEDVLLTHEGGLHIDLGELGLAVGAQVFVAEAAGDLEVSLVSGDHQQLFELLGGLGEGVELARMQAAGDEIVPRPLRRALEEDRRFDLDETAGVEEIAHVLDHAVAKD